MVPLLFFFSILAKVAAWEDLQNIPGSFVGIYDQYSKQCICVPTTVVPNLFSPSPTATLSNQLIIRPAGVLTQPQPAPTQFLNAQTPSLPSASDLEPKPTLTVRPFPSDEVDQNTQPTLSVEPSSFGDIESTSAATDEFEASSPPSPSPSIQPSTTDEADINSPLDEIETSSPPSTTSEIYPNRAPTISGEPSITEQVDPSSAAALAFEPSPVADTDTSAPLSSFGVDASSPPTFTGEPSVSYETEQDSPPSMTVETSAPVETSQIVPTISSGPPGNETQATSPEPSFTNVILPTSIPELTVESTTTTPEPSTGNEETTTPAFTPEILEATSSAEESMLPIATIVDPEFSMFPDLPIIPPGPLRITMSPTPEVGITEEPAPTVTTMPMNIESPIVSSFPSVTNEATQYSPDATVADIMETPSAPQETRTTAIEPSTGILYPTPIVTAAITIFQPASLQVPDDIVKPDIQIDDTVTPASDGAPPSSQPFIPGSIVSSPPLSPGESPEGMETSPGISEEPSPGINGAPTTEPSSAEIPDIYATSPVVQPLLSDVGGGPTTPSAGDPVATTTLSFDAPTSSSPIDVSAGPATPEPSTTFPIEIIGPTPLLEPTFSVESSLPDAPKPTAEIPTEPIESYELSASETPQPAAEEVSFGPVSPQSSSPTVEPSFQSYLTGTTLDPSPQEEVIETAEPSSTMIDSYFPPALTPEFSPSNGEPPIGTPKIPGVPDGSGPPTLRKPTITPQPGIGSIPMQMPTKTPMVSKLPKECNYKPWMYKVLVLQKKGEKRRLLGITCVNGEFRYCELQEEKKIIAEKEVNLTVYGLCLSECESEKIDSYFKMKLVKEYYVGGTSTGWIVKPAAMPEMDEDEYMR